MIRWRKSSTLPHENGQALESDPRLHRIFLAGILVGGLVTLRVGRNFAQRLPMSEQFGPQLLRRLVTQLDLTPEQQEKMKPIVSQAAEELRELRRSTQRTSAAVVVRMQGDIAALLTPAQKVKFDELVAQQRDRFKRFMDERGRRRGEHPPGMGDRPPPPR
jgi:Spy/CpxP family protein refolding chaperone